MDGYEQRSFTAQLDDGKAVTHDIYEQGSGPVVVIVQELPGIGQETLSLAQQFVSRGFCVVIPHLFGPLGRISMLGNIGRVFCMRREFRVFEANRTSPVVTWLRALCAEVKERHNVPGVGVIGMCLTGNFAISLMADEAVLGGVASQPSLPIGKQKQLHMSDEDISAVREAIDQKGHALAYRFEADKLCTAEKFAAYASTFNDNAERIKLVTLPGKGHSVLTLDLVDQAGEPTRAALEEVLAYFQERLHA